MLTLIKSFDTRKVIIGAASVLMLLAAMFVPQLAGAQTNDVFGLQYGKQTGLAAQDPRQTVALIIRIFMGFLGTIAIVIILIGGFKWMTAGGNDEKVGEAKKLIASGIIGLIIILSAYAITNFVLTQLIDVTNAGR